MSVRETILFETQESFRAPVIYPKYSWQVKTERFLKYDVNIEPIEVTDQLDTAQKWITYPCRYKVSFPIQTIKPKVQKIRNVEPFKLPKDVAVERKRKQYANIDFVKVLKDSNIETIHLYPMEVLEKIYPKAFTSEKIFNPEFFLPLDWFDNKDLEIYSEAGWLDLGNIDDKQYPLPAIGLLPNFNFENESKDLIENEAVLLTKQFDIDSRHFQDINTNLFVWRYIAVRSYDQKSDKWLVSDLETFKSFKIHRILFKFIAEDPEKYIERLQYALDSRKEFEKIILFETVLDSYLYLSTFPKRSSIEKIILRVLEKTRSRKELQNTNEIFLETLREQIRHNYNKNESKFEFKKFLQKNQNDYKFLQTSDEALCVQPCKQLNSVVKNMQKLRQTLRFLNLFYCHEVVSAVSKVMAQCIHLETMTLFSCSAAKPVSLDDFKSNQHYSCKVAVNHLKGFWVDNISENMHLLLRNTGKGWMDVNINDWFIYAKSKISTLLQQVRYRMEDSLQYFLESSVVCYTTMLCGPCEDNIMSVVEDFEWTDDFRTTPFQSKNYPPVFFVVINMEESGAVLSTDPNEFLPTVVNIYHNSLILTCTVKRTDPKIMHNLVFAKNIYLDPGDQIEELYHKKRSLLENSYEKAVIPLKSYLRKYDQFKDLYFLIIHEYIKDLKSQNLTSQAIKETIINQKRLKEQVQIILPLTIIIGPFYINVEPLKKFIINKYQQIIDALLEFFTQRMREINENLLDAFSQIFLKISEKSTSIEHIYELKDFIITIPNQIETLDDQLKVMIIEYEILDYFLHNLSDEQFDMKWQAFGYPYKIFKKISETNEQHKIDIDIFKKNHISELAAHQDKLESINEEVSQFGYNFDSTKVPETAVEARKLWKILEDMGKNGKILQHRQILFELEEVSLDFIQQIVASFKPYYDLWMTCNNFLKLEELCMGNALVSLDIIDIKEQMQSLEDSLTKLKDIFAEKPEVQNVAKVFLNHIDEFKPSVEIIDWLKNENWLMMHWLELAHKSKLDIKYSTSINFHFCVKKGILKHLELVRDIGGRAVAEADSIRKALEEEERLRKEEEERKALLKKSRRCRTDIL